MALTPSPSPNEQPYGGPERRRAPRASAPLSVRIDVKDRRFETRVRDVSKSGVCFSSPVEIPEMTLLRIDLELPGKPVKHLRADGAVVRCVKGSSGEHSIAVFFTAIDAEARADLESFVAERLSRV